MNERTTNLTPNTSTEKYSDSAEFKFNEKFYIAEGAAGLLAHVVCHKQLDGIPESVLASATYAIQDAIGEIGKIFENLHEHSLDLQKKIALQKKDEKGATATEAININHARPIDNNSGDIEGEFNHQHIIAEGAAGTLFKASQDPQGSMNNPVLNSTAYSLQSTAHEMNKHFQALLTLYNSDNKETIEEMREAETTRQVKIMELVAEFEEDHPQLRNDSIDAIGDGTTAEAFQEHVLRAISLKNANLEHNVQ